MEHVADLGDGIHRIVVPLPFPSPPSVNCYAFEGEAGITLLDCGVDSADGRAALYGGLEALGAAPTELHRLIGSHLHVDHVGLAKRMVEDIGCEWVMHASSGDEVAHYNDWTLRRGKLADLVETHGAPPEAVAQFRREWPRPDWYGQALAPTHPVADGDRIPLGADRWLTVLHTPGHQPNHISLVDSRTELLFSGDHLLPRITPFIPYTGDDSDNLGDYLESIERIEELQAGVTHPAHGAVIERGKARARQITLHHERRMGAMLQELRASGPMTAWQVMEATFRPHLSHFEQRLAIQETLSHLEHLRRAGSLERAQEEGRFWYRILRPRPTARHRP